MSYVSNREIASMSQDARESRLLELQEELLQLRAGKHLVAPLRTSEHTRQLAEVSLDSKPI